MERSRTVSILVNKPLSRENNNKNSVDYLLEHWDRRLPVDPLLLLEKIGGSLRVYDGDRDAYYPGSGTTLYVSTAVMDGYPQWESRFIIGRELQFFAMRVNSLNLSTKDELFVSMQKMSMRLLLPLTEMAYRIVQAMSLSAISTEFSCPLPILDEYLRKHISKGRLPHWP